MSDFAIGIEQQLNKLGRDLQQVVERIVPLEDKGHDFRPRCDILESNTTYKVVLDVPGLEKEEISISLKDYVLTIKGERVEDVSETETYRRHERPHGMFSRSFALPKNVATEKVEAHFKNGVLAITMGKLSEGEDATTIPIK